MADQVLNSARVAVESGVRGGRRRPVLTSVHRGGATPFAGYLRQQRTVAERVGIEFRSVELDPTPSAIHLRSTLTSLNGDETVDGVLLEHPLPAGWAYEGAIAALEPRKDVDGVGIANLGRLLAGHPGQVPAVAEAAVRFPRHYGVPLRGRRAAVVGRSETVGIPLALLLLARGESGDATVTIAHSRTAHLGKALEGCDVVFSCAGQPGLLNRTVVPRGASVVDVGVGTIPDPQRAGGVRTVGDADSADLEGWASALTPVPGGVGPVTVACLMANVVRSWNWTEVRS